MSAVAILSTDFILTRADSVASQKSEIPAKEAEDFVLAGVGGDGDAVGLDEVEEGVLEGGEFEEEVFFGDLFEEAAAVGAGGAYGGVDEGFVGDAVGAGVGGEVDEAVGL